MREFIHQMISFSHKDVARDRGVLKFELLLNKRIEEVSPHAIK